MTKIRLVGDVHGKIGQYIDIVKNCPYSLQVGDMGLNYGLLSQLDPIRHRFVPGNHDNYDNLPQHSLGDFGLWNDIFYCRGAFSIDKQYRTEGVSWWPNEELTYSRGCQALEVYSVLKPEIVVTHDCPTELLQDFVTLDLGGTRGTITNQILQSMFDVHKPNLWFFGHHHQNKFVQCKGTGFGCLGELFHIDIER